MTRQAGQAMFELTICNSQGEVLRRYDMDRAERAHKRVLIGRADDCDVRIAHAMVSRHHCSIEPVNDGDEKDASGAGHEEWIVRDLGSTHGVLVNGERVPEVTLRPGLQVVIGPAVLKFDLAAKSAAAQIRAELGER